MKKEDRMVAAHKLGMRKFREGYEMIVPSKFQEDNDARTAFVAGYLGAKRRATKSADFIKRIRDRLNLSPEQLGARLGVSMHSIYRYERGGTLPEPIEFLAMELLRKEGFDDTQIERMKR